MNLKPFDMLKKMVQAGPARPRQGMVLVLELGASRIKMALMERKEQSLTLHRFGWREAMSTEPESRVKLLKELVEELQPPDLRVATSITGPSVAVRYIQLPKMTPEEVKSAVRYEAEKYIPFKMDEVVLDSQVLAEEGTKLRVLLAAAKRNSVESTVKLLTEARLEPVLVDIDAFCLVNAFLANCEKPAGTVALLHVGAAYSTINVIQDRTLSFTRDIAVAGHHATRLIAERLGVPQPEAEQLKLRPGDKAEEVRQAQQPFYDNLLNEIRLSFDFYENQFEKAIDRVWLSGGSLRSDDLVGVLDEGLRLEMKRWNPLEKVELAPKIDRQLVEEWTGSLGVCVGLAKRGL